MSIPNKKSSVATYQTVLDFKNERVPETAVKKIELLMNDLGITPEDRQVVVAARAKAEETGGSALALEIAKWPNCHW